MSDEAQVIYADGEPTVIVSEATPASPTVIESIETGPQGPTGPQGLQGEQGDIGPQGPQGIQGVQGVQGEASTVPGPQGPQGIQGIEGDEGPQGPQGIQGIQGPQGIQGIQGEIGPQGPEGDASIVPGPQGPQGIQGEEGPQGEQGLQGLPGTPGAEGAEGPEGPQGPQGIQGPQGLTGPEGPQGVQGEIGPQGVPGLPGAEGAEGPEGPQGPQGVQGPEGPAGTTDHGLLLGLDEYEDHPQYKVKCGVSDRTATLSYASGMFTATKVTNYDVWTGGKRWPISDTRSVAIPNDNTFYYVYFDVDGVMKASTSAWSIVGDAAPFATVYRLSDSVAAIGDERHSMNRDRLLHAWAHETIGTRYDSLHGGLTGTFGATTFSITQGDVWDEDLELAIVGTQTQCRRWSRITGGAAMTFVDAATTLYKLNGANIQYDNAPLVDAAANRYVCHYVFATNDNATPIYCLVGQQQHTTLANAQNETSPVFAGLSTVEWKLLYKVIYRNTGGTPTYIATMDYRNVSGVAVTFTPTSHASLTGLDADDHPQYLKVADHVAGDTGEFNTVLNGTTDPDEYDGSDGDFYINTTTHYIFGPKTDGVWGEGTNMVGTGTGGGDFLVAQIFS